MTTNTNNFLQETRKLVIVGDGMTGKTCLLYAFKGDKFSSLHSPTIFETHAVETEVDGKIMQMVLFDTAGQDDSNRLCPLSYLSYSHTDIALICFSVTNPVSLLNVLEQWNPEIRHFCRQCPMILVACKSDLRTDKHTIETLKQKDMEPITTEEGRKIAAQIKADAYMECSAKTHEGVHELFVHAARLSCKKQCHHQSNNKCCLQ